MSLSLKANCYAFATGAPQIIFVFCRVQSAYNAWETLQQSINKRCRANKTIKRWRHATQNIRAPTKWHRSHRPRFGARSAGGSVSPAWPRPPRSPCDDSERRTGCLRARAPTTPWEASPWGSSVSLQQPRIRRRAWKREALAGTVLWNVWCQEETRIIKRHRLA